MALDKVRCPTCRTETRWEGNRWRPFCSERCKLVDLGNWAMGKYRIPEAQPPPAESDEDSEEDDA